MKITVIGAGHAGQALAGYLSLEGHEVLLYNRTRRVADNIRKAGGISLKGCVEGKAGHVAVTSSLLEAAGHGRLILVCIPAHEHGDLAAKMAGLLRDGQQILLIPGRTLGAFYFDRELKLRGCRSDVTVGETDTFMLTSRKLRDGVSQIFFVKREVQVASLERERTADLYETLKNVFPMVKPAATFLQTSLANVGAVFHPLPAMLNIGRIENKQIYLHYKEGITPAICRLIEKLDDERVGIGRALGVPVLSARDWIKKNYGSPGENLYEAIQNTAAYDFVAAPVEISTRYIYEDVLTGVVPMYYLAEAAGSSFVTLKLTIDLSEALLSYPFRENGRRGVKDNLTDIL